jgi:hypothetical protein
MAEGKLVHTEQATPATLLDSTINGEWAAVLTHQAIPFISYPYEWPFGMLKDAALLHLELLETTLAEDMILKDASAYNVQWFGTSPIFIDIPSFETLIQGTPWWDIASSANCSCILFYSGIQGRAVSAPAAGAWRASNRSTAIAFCPPATQARRPDPCVFAGQISTNVFQDPKEGQERPMAAGFTKSLIQVISVASKLINASPGHAPSLSGPTTPVSTVTATSFTR